MDDVYLVGFLRGIICVHRIKTSCATVQKVNRVNCLCLVTTAILLFSPCQFENWLMAIEVAIFLVNLGIIGCLFFASKCSTRGWMMPSLAVLFAVIASCSFAHGLSSWPLLICTFFLIRISSTRRIALIVFSLAVFLLVAACYFMNFSPPNVGVSSGWKDSWPGRSLRWRYFFVNLERRWRSDFMALLFMSRAQLRSAQFS